MLEKTAALMILVYIITSLITNTVYPKWSFIKSSNSGICYEAFTSYGISVSKSMSPVDSKYCEDKK